MDDRFSESQFVPIGMTAFSFLLMCLQLLPQMALRLFVSFFAIICISARSLIVVPFLFLK